MTIKTEKMEQDNKETYWSQYVETYEEKQRYVVGAELISLTKQALLEEQDLGNVLELGCGTGLYTEALQQNASHVVATDLSDDMIAFARQKRGELSRVEFRQADALHLEFEPGSFDTVFMANLIHIIGDAERVIQESYRMLKNDGLLIITTFAIHDMGFFRKMGMFFRYVKAFGKPSDESTREKTTQNSLERMLLNNGFEIAQNRLLGRNSKAVYITCKKTG